MHKCSLCSRVSRSFEEIRVTHNHQLTLIMQKCSHEVLRWTETKTVIWGWRHLDRLSVLLHWRGGKILVFKSLALQVTWGALFFALFVVHPVFLPRNTRLNWAQNGANGILNWVWHSYADVKSSVYESFSFSVSQIGFEFVETFLFFLVQNVLSGFMFLWICLAYRWHTAGTLAYYGNP